MTAIMDIRQAPKGIAVIFRFSKLTSHYRTHYHLRLALNSITELLSGYVGEAYVLESLDVILLLNNVKPEIIDRLIFNLRNLFLDDPLSKVEGLGEDSICSVYFLTFELNNFINVSNEMLKDYQARIKRQKMEGKTTNINLNSEVLRTVENKLYAIDIAKFIRRQPIAAVLSPTTNPTQIYEEVFVSLIHLKKILDDRITECNPRIINTFIIDKLDEIVLKYITFNKEHFFKKPVSLNLNIATVVSEKFEEFVKLIPEEQRGALIVEFQLTEIFYDMQGFKIARDFLHNNGVRICIDGLDNFSFLQIDRESLEADLIKLQWNQDMAKAMNKNENQALVDKITKTEPTRIILTRCDNEQAVLYGNALGIKLYQGWHIDRKLGLKD